MKGSIQDSAFSTQHLDPAAPSKMLVELLAEF
jgi:hypothetical protein